MLIITVNVGSSSTRMHAFDAGSAANCVFSLHLDRTDHSPAEQFRSFLSSLPQQPIVAVAHRVVHGGAHFRAPTVMTEEALERLDELSSLAPLHNPRALQWIRACKEVTGENVPHIAVFDTALYVDLPAVAQHYAIPQDLAKQHGIRRYGFHGIAHRAIFQRWRALHPELQGGGRLISLQLGSGCSMTAFRDGKPADTSMGFTPLEGLVMASRSGDLDPGIVTFLQQRLALSPEQLEALLNQQSGLLGLSGESKSVKDLEESGSERAKFALELYAYRVRKYLGAYMAVLGGADGVAFAGGVGENSALIRRLIIEPFAWLGVALDPAANSQTRGSEQRISSDSSSIKVYVIPVDEAALLVQEAREVLTQRTAPEGAL